MTPINTNPAAGRACGAVRLCREHADILSISHDAVDQFINAASERGLVITKPIVYDRLTRCPITGKHKNNKVGAYIFHGDGIPAGGYQNHTDGLGWQNWRAAIGRRMTHQEIIANRARIDEAKRQREIELHNKQEQAAAKAVHIWNCARPASDDFRYLIGKKIKSHGARQYKNAVVLPLYDESGRLVSLQFISADGQKWFLSGGKKQGCYFTIGDLKKRILISEGFATGASLHEATGEMTVIAFDANNLLPAAQKIRKKYRDIDIIVCGDNDLSGVGQKAANEAAAAVGGLVHIPDVPGSDWNDILSGGRHD